MSAQLSVNNLITEHLDTWTQAIETKFTAGSGSSNKLNLVGIQKLRELILEMAVHGLLVPQDPHDEPASVLLEKITAEKAQLIKDKIIKKTKALPEISEDEKPFDLPNGWEWVRLGDLGETQTGATPPKANKHHFGSDVPFIKPGDIEKGIVDYFNEGLTFEGADSLGRIANSGSVLMVCIGTIGKAALIDRDCAFNQQINSISPHVEIGQYLYWAMATNYFVSSAWELSSSTTIAILNKGKWSSIPVPIPPLEEQNRIVAKVDELMALCDQLESETLNHIDTHQTLVETLLGNLVNPDNTANFDQAWSLIAQNFDVLFTTEHSIESLKQTILQLAVMGKLVPQNPNDEPASKLLEKIAAEKAQLIADKKIKKPKSLVDFEGLEEIRFDTPNNWAWIRLSDIADIVRGGSPRPAGDPKFYDGDIPFLKVGDVTNKTGMYVEGFNYSIKEAGLKKTRFIDTRTVLLTNSGATLGIPAICEFPATFNDGIAAFIYLSDSVDDEFLYLYLTRLSKWFLDFASRGQGQPNLNTDIIKSTWFPLPPVEEQIRIVAKVNELMTLCDQLKTQLQTAQQTQIHLAQSMIRDII
ncbi:restriction endonuclease subunit S [Thiomicrospira sp. S5]|uniref:restriction endonuclease subunit S n=1 Tax=Thiomicrospira sp. S5 TaxID=1803865 RepID=UPI000F8A11FB|nr:restriction endonuclease subunit S [Thiomicrospira sp. S5]AZR82142.1 hypothetical protein AYJ59_07505 [Thiomicrospira sp. S5]